MCACAARNHAQSDKRASVYVSLDGGNCVIGGAAGVPGALLSPTSLLALTVKNHGDCGWSSLSPQLPHLRLCYLYICIIYGDRIDTAYLPLILLLGGAFCFQVSEALFRSLLGTSFLPTSFISPRPPVLPCTPTLIAAMTCPTQAETGLHS